MVGSDRDSNSPFSNCGTLGAVEPSGKPCLVGDEVVCEVVAEETVMVVAGLVGEE